MKNEYLKHTLATIGYRFQKSVKYRNEAFGDFNLGKGSRSTKEIINHMYSVLSWTTSVVKEDNQKRPAPKKLDLEGEIARFTTELKTLDTALSQKKLDINFSKKLLQGPLSDVLTHIGQISMLSRLNDNPIEREDFSAADIKS